MTTLDITLENKLKANTFHFILKFRLVMFFWCVYRTLSEAKG